MKNFKFVLASNDGVELNPKHFGDSEMFYLYEILEDGTINFLRKITNEFRKVDESTAHGSQEKRLSIISYLGGEIDFIIASQASPNFKQINMNTKVCPVVSEITNIDDLLVYLKSNFDVLEKTKNSKIDNTQIDILKIKRI